MELGRLERVELRDIWANEALHFTPWLAQERNLALLSEAVGIDLEHEATEKSVGPFSADILCKDTATENWVLIENQLERTDHKHLGQLITYASGLKAVTIIWIASPFTQEHRSALDWLNEITDDKINFFGLEVELWKIDDSNIAPKFNVISKPNDWSRTVHAAASRVEREGLTEAKQLQFEFWTGFHEFVTSRNTVIRPTKPLPQHWMNIGIGRSGFKLHAIASTYNSDAGSYDSNEIRAEFEIHRNSDANFAAFEADKDQIEAELGFPVIWHNDPTKISKRFFVKRSVDLTDRSDWPNQFKWLLDNLETFHRVLAPRVKALAV
jgi:hypothetical protein